MTHDFKVGERVNIPEVGKKGTILSFDEFGCMACIKLDNDRHISYFMINRLEKISMTIDDIIKYCEQEIACSENSINDVKTSNAEINYWEGYTQALNILLDYIKNKSKTKDDHNAR